MTIQESVQAIKDKAVAARDNEEKVVDPLQKSVYKIEAQTCDECVALIESSDDYSVPVSE